MLKIQQGQRHYWPYGMGPRSRGRATRGRGRGSVPPLRFPAPVHYPGGADAQFVIPMVARSGIVSAWPRPQAPEPNAGGEFSTPPPAAAASKPTTPPPVYAIPQMDLASLLPGRDAQDPDGSVPSPSSALHALADIALDDIRPQASPPSLDLSGARGGPSDVTMPVPNDVMLRSRVHPIDADLRTFTF